MSDIRSEKRKPSKRFKKSENVEKVKSRTEKESKSDITVKKRGKRTARDEKNVVRKPPGNEPTDPSKPLKEVTEKFENGETSSEINRDPPPKGYQEKEPVQEESKNSQKKRVKCPLSSKCKEKCCKRNKRENKKANINAPENGIEVSSEEITKADTSSSKSKRIPPPKGYILIDRRHSYSEDEGTQRPVSYDEYQDVNEERTKPGTLFSKVTHVPPPKGFHEREPILLEGRRCYSDNVDIPCSTRYDEYDHIEATLKRFEAGEKTTKSGVSPSPEERFPRPKEYQAKEPRRQSYSKKVNTPPTNIYTQERGREESPRQFTVSKKSRPIKPGTSPSKVKRAPPPKTYHEREPIRVNRRSYTKNVDAPRPFSYDEYEDGEEPPKLVEVSKERITPGISPSEIKYIPPPNGYHERAHDENREGTTHWKWLEERAKQGIYNEQHSHKRKYNKEESESALATTPCRPCSAEGGVQRIEIRVISPEGEPKESDDLKPSDSVSIILTPKENNFMRCDNEKYPSNIERKNKSGGRKRPPDEPTEINYDDVDVIYLCGNKDCYERSSTDLIGGLARCGSNKAKSATVIDFCDSSLRFVGSTKKKESRKRANYDDIEDIEPLYSNRNINEVRTIFITDPRLLQQSSNYVLNFDDNGRDSRIDLIKKYTYHLLSSSTLGDSTESPYCGHKWSGNQEDESDNVYCREARNEILISSLFTILLVLFILFILFPPLVR